MKELFTISLVLIFSSVMLYSQKLADEMKLTENGTRLILGSNESDGLYDESHMPVIKIYFPMNSFIRNLESTDEDILAEVEIDGVRFDSVGIRIKGLTSRSVLNEKYSFNISIDEFKKQNYNGYETLNLNNGYEDPSFVREILYNHIGREYSPCPKTNYAQLYINDRYWGPYANVQQLDGNYIRDWFLSNDGTRWRAINKEWSEGFSDFPSDPFLDSIFNDPNFDPNDPILDSIFGGPNFDPNDSLFNDPNFDPTMDPDFSFFGEGKSSLNYLGDASEYEEHYQLKKTKKDNPWEDLAICTEKLNTLPTDNSLYDKLKHYLDIDKALWFIAHENIFTDTDGYLYKGGMDYYVYWEAETGRLVPLEYDGNSILPTEEGFEEMNWRPFYRENDVRFPLLNRLMASPDLRQRYLAHYRTILEEHFISDSLHSLIDNYAAQIRESVSMDPKRNYEPDEFEQGLIRLKNIIENRRNYLLNNTKVNVSGVHIESLSKVESSPLAAEPIEIQTIVSGEIPAKSVRLYYGKGIVGTFERIEMTETNPGEYTAMIPGFEAGEFVRYYVEAIAENDLGTSTFYPKGAEHDVFIYRVSSVEIESDIVINELVASNDNGMTDQDGEFDDWIELFNTSSDDVNLSGYLLSDNFQKLDKYEFPEGTIIAGNDYLIIWADDDEEQDGLHTSFKLSSSSGEAVYLSNPDQAIIDEVIFDALDPNISYSRKPNGTGSFVKTEPTFQSNNDIGASSTFEFTDPSQFKIFPNPSTGQFSIVYDTEIQKSPIVEIFDYMGRLVYQNIDLQPTKEIKISTSLHDGLYVLRLNREISKKLLISKTIRP